MVLISKTGIILHKLLKSFFLKMVKVPQIILKMFSLKIVNKQNLLTGISFGNYLHLFRLSFDDLRMQFDNRIK